MSRFISSAAKWVRRQEWRIRFDQDPLQGQLPDQFLQLRGIAKGNWPRDADQEPHFQRTRRVG